MQTPTLMTAEQLAESLNTSPNTVRRLTREGQIPALKLGAEYRYDWAAVRQQLLPPPPAVTARRILIPLIEAVLGPNGTSEQWGRAVEFLQMRADAAHNDPNLAEVLRASWAEAEQRMYLCAEPRP